MNEKVRLKIGLLREETFCSMVPLIKEGRAKGKTNSCLYKEKAEALSHLKNEKRHQKAIAFESYLGASLFDCLSLTYCMLRNLLLLFASLRGVKLN